MKALDEIRNRLSKYPSALVEDKGSMITIKAADELGFDVSCTGTTRKSSSASPVGTNILPIWKKRLPASASAFPKSADLKFPESVDWIIAGPFKSHEKVDGLTEAKPVY